MLRRVPIPIEHAACVELLCEGNKVVRGLRPFCERRRIGNLQVQSGDVRMQKIAAIERACDSGKAVHLRAEVHGHAVAPAEIAIDVIERARSPFLKASAVAARLQEWHAGDEHAGRTARHPVSRLFTEGETPSIWK
jgi:hypothetical protein